MAFFPNPIPLPTLYLAYPELFLLVASCVVLLVDLFFAKKNKNITFGFSIASLIGTVFILLMQYNMPSATTFSDMFIFDKLGSLLKIVMALSVLFIFIYARVYLKEKSIPRLEFYLLSLLSLLGMMVLVSANNTLPLYLGLELLSLPMIAMVAMQRTSSRASEAAIKFFVISALASGILLYGLSMLYGATKTLDIPQMASVLQNISKTQYPVVILGLVFVVIGIVFKLGAVPFHMWVPDVYDGAPNLMVLFIGTAPKVAGLGMAIRLLVDAMPNLNTEWQAQLIIIAVLSIALGNVVAIAQTSLKRMLAYSSIAHMGYMLLGLLTATKIGYASAVNYIIIYSIMAMGSFATLVMMSRKGIEIENIKDLQGLNTRDPWLAFMMLLIMFSMAGIPPLAGFFAKIGVLEALIGVHLVWLAVYAIVFAIIGSYYYIRVVKVMYFDAPEETAPIHYGTDTRVAMSINGLLVLALGIFAGVLFTICQHVFGL